MRTKLLVPAFLLMVMFPLSSAAVDLKSGYFATGFGCFVCKTTSNSLSIVISQKCYQVGDEQLGDGIFCENEYIWDGWVCLLEYNPCFSVVSGGIGLQAEPSCTVDVGGSCDPSCESCTVVYE